MHGLLFHMVPGGRETPDVHVSRLEVNQNLVTKPGLKQGLIVMFWASKIASEAISQHQIQKIFPGGARPRPPYLLRTHYLGICIDKADQCNFASVGPVLAL